MNQSILSFYGLKWHPFTQDVPVEGFSQQENWPSLFWKLENLVLDGGFALITGESGMGKSILMRSIQSHFEQIKDVKVQTLSRPQSSLSDFYRELGYLFDVDLKPSNRFGGYKMLRDKWQNFISTCLFKPVLLVDEAQEMLSSTLCELRLLSSQKLDSQNLISIVLAGDERLQQKLQNPELIPVGTRIKTRYKISAPSKNSLLKLLLDITNLAGRPDLFSEELYQTLTEHCLQNPRIMMNQAAEILNYSYKNKKSKIDVDVFFEVFQATKSHSKKR